MKIQIPKFQTKKELFDFLIENKDTLIAQKKSEIKKADGFLHTYSLNKEGEVIKANEPVETSSIDEIKVVVIINTTNLMDSHKDVHMPGIWNKSLKENKFIMHIQEHQMSQFDKIISEGKDLKSYVKFFNWTELGYTFEGKTQALVFESIVRRKRNSYMFDQYAAGYVKNHSVGMRYMKLLLAVNDEDYGAEFEAWEKYISKVANKEAAEDNGYFWVVKEAKIIEGSAVPLGSNYVTPTLENNKETPQEIEIKNLKYLKELFNIMKEPQQEPFSDTQIESTRKEIELLKSINQKLK